MLILPNFNIFNNLSLAINNSTNIVVGNLKIDDSLGISKSTANLRFNYLKYDDYFLDIGQSPYLSSGSLLKKLLWLNTINSNNDIILSFDQLNYRDNIFDNPSLEIKFRQGYFKLSDLDFLSPTLDFKGNIEVDISSINPTLNINIASDNFQYQNQNLIDKNDEDLGNQFFKLPAINEFSGEIAINIKNLLLNSWQASDVKIAGKIDSAIVNFDNFNLKTYQGEAVYKGSMVFKNAKTINGSVELIGVDAGQVLFNLMNINNISGISNLSAVINSTAENKQAFFKNLDSSGQFIGANIAMKGFGIYDLAFKVAQPKKYQVELGKLNNILYNPDIITTFTNVSGAFAIKKGENQGQLNIQTSSVGINGVVSGAFDIASQSFDSNANFIFISGTRQNQIPLNIAVNFKGSVGAIEKSTNLTQVEQYLNQKLPSPTPPATVNPPQN